MSATLILGISIGVAIGVLVAALLAACFFVCIQVQKKNEVQCGSEQRGMVLPIRVKGLNASSVLSDTTDYDSPVHTKDQKIFSLWFGGGEKNSILSNSGLPSYPYRDLQKATNNFTAKLGEGAFGPVYKALMPQGGTFAVKMLSSDSRQGEREFLTEVTLLGRLHHRNLVNLVGYCAEKGQRILVYEFMSNGSLAEALYGGASEPLSWDMRVQIAQDVARGIEYLHEGATPPVIHRDIKSANILLDGSMRARVADFGLSKEVSTEHPNSGVRGTFGYVDPEYISTHQFTLKSDVYSFGILLFELMTARNPQKGLMDYVGLVVLRPKFSFLSSQFVKLRPDLSEIEACGLLLSSQALLSVEGEGWEEILDERIYGRCDLTELAAIAAVAKQCVNTSSRNRPKMREVLQQLSKLGKRKVTGEQERLSNNDDDTVKTSRAGEVDVQRHDLLRLASIPEREET